MSDIAIKVERLSKAYKLYNNPVDRMKESLHPFRKKYHHDFYALKDVSFEVNKGNSVGIIGVNGSGKSTLLKMIAGVLTPTSGNFIVNGKISALLELGAGFNPEFTGFENVYFQGAIMGYTREEMDNKADDILSFADIGEFIYQSVKTYSSGMFVRLAFAVAVAVDPDILIIDEALAVGDVRFQLKCMKKMNSFKEEGKTILLVTHGLDTLKTFTNIGIFLNNGKIQYMGDPVEAGLSYYRFLFPNNSDQTNGTGDTFKKNKIGTDENSKLDKSKYVEANLDNSKSFKIDMDENSQMCNSKYLEVNLDDNKSYGKGGAWINFIRIYGLKDENVFVGGKELNINISYAWNKDEIKRLIDEKILLSNLLFGVRFENARGIVLTDVATLRFDNFHIDPLSYENSSCVLNFKIQIPKLMAGDYFLSPGIALGELDNMLALKEYVYLINLHCLPDEKILGLMKWDYAISEIERG